MVRVVSAFLAVVFVLFTVSASFAAGDTRSAQITESRSASLGIPLPVRESPNSTNSTIMDIITGASTSGNARAPIGTFNYERVAWLITPSEMAAAGYPVGAVNAIGFNYSTAPNIAVTGNLTVYMENTSDVTFTRGTSWATITGTMTLVHNNAITLPAATGILDIPFAGGSPFSYTGGGLYIAFEYANPSNPLSTGTVVLCNTALTNGLAGQQSNTALPTTLVASNFRPWTRLGTALNDIMNIPYVYALGKIPIPYGVPQVIKAPAINVSASPATFDLTLTVKEKISGTVRFTNTVTNVTVAANSQQEIAFAAWTPTIAEDDSIIVATSAIPGEDITANNRAVMVQNVNNHRFSYSQGTASSGGVGFTGATGDFVARFSSGTSAVIDSIQVNFSAGGQPYQLGIWDATGAGNTPGTNLFTSATFTSVAGVQTIPVNPAVAVNGLFYLGVRQTGTTNVSFSFQAENPIRDSTFYYTSPTGGTTWTDFHATGSAFRFMIEADIALGFPMVYSSSTATQNTIPTVPGYTNQQIIGMQVVTNGNLLPVSATSFTINTNGTTSPATDISNARIYYTGSSSTFAAVNQFGSTVALPNGVVTIPGSRALLDGTNYFWLTYDINPLATVGHVVDGEFSSVTVAGTPETPTVTAPAGNRLIRSALAAGDYTVGLTLFNRILGREVAFEKSIHRVLRDVPVGETSGKNDLRNHQTATAQSLTTKTRQVEMDEVSWTLMDRGKPFVGRPRVEVTDADREKYGLDAQVLAVYPTITAALADLNAVGVAGPVRFLLDDTNYPTETYPLTISAVSGASPTSPITIRPQTGVTTTIPGNSGTCIFKLNGADYITIDGSNSGGTDRSMTISNSNTGVSSAVIWIASVAAPVDSATNNTIKNCIISGNSPNTTFIGIVTSGSSMGGIAEAQNINNTIRNNAIFRTNYGIATVGPTDNESGLLITQNTIGVTDTIGFNGIALFQEKNALVSKNTISKVVTATTNTTSGIRVAGTADSVLISGNTISDVRNRNVGGYGSNGIQLNSSVTTAKVTVANNFIRDIASVGYADGTVADNGYGIIAVTGGPYRIYYNSINLNLNQDSLAGRPAAMNVTAGVPAGAIDMRNNIFNNSQTVGTNRYAVYSSAGDTAFVQSNYNDYFTTGPNLGFLGAANRANLTAWQAATGKDGNSVSGDPLFVSASNLHITSSSSPASNAGTPIASVTDDIDGDARSLTTPDIGADEFGSTTTTLSVGILSGWNMISNPVTNPVPDDSARHLYPTIVSRVFRFNNGYIAGDTMHTGIGYWGKFPAATTASITGTPHTRDSISVNAGWNMVGSISNTVDTSTIVSVPSGLRSSNWFGYAGGYVVVSQITPGKAYWIKSNAVGKFVFANPLVRPAKGAVSGSGNADALNTITITDSKGGSQTLYFGADANKSIPVALYTMPPAPPVGAFDARFQTADGGSMVQTYSEQGSHEFMVSVQSDAYPLTVSWNVKDAVYQVTAGGAVQTARGEGTMKIASSDVQRIALTTTGTSELPKEFALSQNYPNPFNPTTSIKYSLPVQSRVTMQVYNVLGQNVRTLVNDDMPAGYQAVVWDGTGNGGQQLASGTYFLRLSAQGTNGKTFNEIRKLLLLK